MSGFLTAFFVFFILLQAPLQILTLVLSTRSTKVASRCQDFNPGFPACLAETLPLDQESLMILRINFANLNSYQIYIISEKGLQIPGIEPGSLCMLSRGASPRPVDLDGIPESIL